MTADCKCVGEFEIRKCEHMVTKRKDASSNFTFSFRGSLCTVVYWCSTSLISGSTVNDFSRASFKPQGRDIKWVSPLGDGNESLCRGSERGGELRYSFEVCGSDVK